MLWDRGGDLRHLTSNLALESSNRLENVAPFESGELSAQSHEVEGFSLVFNGLTKSSFCGNTAAPKAKNGCVPDKAGLHVTQNSRSSQAVLGIDRTLPTRGKLRRHLLLRYYCAEIFKAERN